jgi:predicted nucleic acid-binding protein
MSPPRSYMDTAVFIDLGKEVAGNLLANRQDDVWFGKRLLLAARAGKITLFTSSLTIAECQHAGGIADEKVQRLYKKMLTSGQYVFLVQDSILIGERARDLLWVHGISLKGGADAIHLASAVEMECTEFITTDGRFLQAHRKEEIFTKLKIRTVTPHESINLPAEYRQTNLYDDETIQ